MNPLHLLWIIPLSAIAGLIAGFVIAAVVFVVVALAAFEDE